MTEILFLAHRIPYPPDKGDKIRSFNVLRALAESSVVHLGAFVDDSADWKHEPALKKICGEVCLRPINTTFARIRGATAIATGQPLTVAYYRDREFASWVGDLAERRSLDGAFAFSSSMGQYVERLRLRDGAVRIMDFCDVDSDKWSQYAKSRGFPLRQIYAREARCLAALEADYVRDFDASLVISQAEARLLRESAGRSGGRIQVVPNGVDTVYFDPSLEYADPFTFDGPAIVFTGAMDYYANVDGVRWFVEEVLPDIRGRVPNAVFAIVGSNPVQDVRALESRDGVLVTGRVPDVRPYLAHAAVVIAPLRIARGVQNKVLEAFAMSRPVVATSNAVQGIPKAVDAGLRVANGRAEFAEEVSDLLERRGSEPRGRDFVISHYSWERNLLPVRELFGLPAVYSTPSGLVADVASDIRAAARSA